MDAETKEYFVSKVAELLVAINEGFSRMERRMAAAGIEPDVRELRDRVLTLEERYRTMQLRIDLLERRTNDQLRNRTLR